MEDVKRVCLLTGASGLLGTAFINRYADLYQIVAVHHRNPIHYATQEQVFVDPINPTQQLAANEHAVYSIRADISKPDGIDLVLREVSAHCQRVDLVINAASIRAWSHLLSPGALDPIEYVMNVNVVAPVRLSVGIAQRFWIQDPKANVQFNRNIINVSSTAGLFIYPDLGQALYGTSKAALNHLTYHLASDFWDIGIRANGIAPDTFPGRVSIDEVLTAIISLDTSQETGKVIPLHITPDARRA